MESWEASYKTRNWKLYKIPVSSPERPPLTPTNDFTVCDGDSELASRIKEDPLRFYRDWEQVAGDLSGNSGMLGLNRLSADWNGHPKGMLVMETFEGVTENPRCFTYLVEISA